MGGNATASIARTLSVGAMLALSILVIAGGGQAPAQGGVPKADWQADSGALASPGEVLSTGVNPAVQALVDDLGVLIDDGDVGEVADIDGRPSGYASFVVTTGESAAKLYWKGDVPARVTEVVAAHPDVETTISSVEWTLAELVEGRDIALEILTSGEHAEFDLQTVGPQPDATGLLVQLGDNTLADAREVESIVAHATRIQVFVETGVHMVPAATRVSDTSPFSGGALIRLHAGSDSFVCSTGVAVVGKTSGNEYMTTAAHCIGGVKSETGYTSGAVKTYNGATTIGSWDHKSAWTEHDRDTSIMPIKASASGSGKAYWGSPTSSTKWPIVGTATSLVGATVCPSGGNSGAHCTFVVQAKNVAHPFGGYNVLHAVRASSTSDDIAQGDSGGPVFQNSGERRLLGFISSVRGAPYLCNYMPINHWHIDLDCGPQMIYVGGMTSLFDDLNIKLK